MLTSDERKAAARRFRLELCYLTDSYELSQLAPKIGVTASSMYFWVGQNGKGRLSSIGRRTVDRIIDRLGPEMVTPEIKKKLYSLAARSAGYDVECQ